MFVKLCENSTSAPSMLTFSLFAVGRTLTAHIDFHQGKFHQRRRRQSRVVHTHTHINIYTYIYLYMCVICNEIQNIRQLSILNIYTGSRLFNTFDLEPIFCYFQNLCIGKCVKLQSINYSKFVLSKLISDIQFR